MEINEKRTPDPQSRAKLAWSGCAVLIVPVLWLALAPSRERRLEEQSSWPLRDAVGPARPAFPSSLTPPTDGQEPEVPREAALLEAGASGRPVRAERLAERVDHMLAEGGLIAPPEATNGDAGGGEGGRFSPFSGPLAPPAKLQNSSAGTGAQSSAFLGVGRAAPILAAAGPFGSAGLVAAGESRRFGPTSAKRAGAVSGFLGAAGRAAGAIFNGTSASAQFGSARAGVTIGSAALGASAPLGATVGGSLIGAADGQQIGSMGQGTDQNNSTLNNQGANGATTALQPVAPVPPPVDALGNTAARDQALKIARCRGFTQAAADSTVLLGRVRELAADAAARLRTKVVRPAQIDANTWKAQEQAALGQIGSLASLRCVGPDGKDYCAGVRSFVAVRQGELSAALGQIGSDIGQLGTAFNGLNGAPPPQDNGYKAAKSAIDIEKNNIAPLVSDPSGRWSAAINSIPNVVCVTPETPDGRKVCVSFAGVKAQVRSEGLVPDQATQQAVSAKVLTSWCDRFGSCDKPKGMGKLADDLAKHNDAVQVWAEFAPPQPFTLTTDAAEHLGQARRLLSAPAGAFSRNFVKGAHELKKSHEALDDATNWWTTLRDKACRYIH